MSVCGFTTRAETVSSPIRPAASTVLHHEWTGRLTAAKENRKNAEADLHALVSRISLLQEQEERTRRAVSRTRQRAVEIEHFHAGTMETLAKDLLSDKSLPLSPMAPIRRHLQSSGSFQFRPVSPVRSPGIQLPPLATHSPMRTHRMSVLQSVTRELKQTQALARMEELSLEASALRAQKDIRLQLVAQTREDIFRTAKELHDSTKAMELQGRTRREEQERLSESRRKVDYDARVAVEEESHHAIAAKVAELEALEERLLHRMQTSEDLKMTPLAGGGFAAATGVSSRGSTAKLTIRAPPIYLPPGTPSRLSTTHTTSQRTTPVPHHLRSTSTPAGRKGMVGSKTLGPSFAEF